MEASVLERPAAARLSAFEIALLVALVLCVRVFAIHSFPIYDDAFITYRYAANLAAGKGLVFNPGASWEPVLGTTTPLYALILAALVRLGADPIAASLAFNFVCDLVSALLIVHLLGRRRCASGAALLAFSIFPPLVRVSVGGMEPPLLVALSLGCIALARARRLTLAGTLAALACTVRPEAVMLVAIVALMTVRGWRDALRFLTPVAIIGVTTMLTLLEVYGYPIPQSVRAKSSRKGLSHEWSRFRQVLRESFAPMSWSLLLLPIVLIGYARVLRSERGLRPFLLFALAMVGAYAASGAKTWGWYFYVPLVAWCLGLGLGIEGFGLCTRRTTAWLQHPALVPIMAVLLAGVGFAATRAFPDMVTPRVYRPMEAWVREVDLARSGARVEASDIGAIGYYSGGTVLDSEGLVWPQALDFGGQLSLIRSFRPEFVLMVGERQRLERFRGDPIHDEYRAVARFNVGSDQDLNPPLESLPETWAQDYIIFQRLDTLASTR